LNNKVLPFRQYIYDCASHRKSTTCGYENYVLSGQRKILLYLTQVDKQLHNKTKYHDLERNDGVHKSRRYAKTSGNPLKETKV
jgi:hypothetical protein